MRDTIAALIQAARDGEPLTRLEVLALAEYAAAAAAGVEELEKALIVTQAKLPNQTTELLIVRAA